MRHGTRLDQGPSRPVEIPIDTVRILTPAISDSRVIAGQGSIGLKLAEFLDHETGLLFPLGGTFSDLLSRKAREAVLF